MATICVCNRLNGKTKRLKVDGINMSSKVADFRSKISKAVEVPIHEIELVYCGQRLQDDKLLKEYCVQPGSTVHALKKVIAEDQMLLPDPLDSVSVQQVVTALQAALINPAYRNTVEKMLKNPEALENIIAASPGLDSDPIAMAILQDAELLAMLADPSHIHKVIEAHPSLGHAAMMVAAAVNEEAVAGGSGGQGTSGASGTYSLDQMSDDEDLEPIRPRVSGSGGQITASQLAAAFAAVAQSPGQSQPSSSSQSSSSPSNSQQQPLISADFFQQALSQVAAVAEGSDGASARPSSSMGGTPQGPPEDVILSQLAQLRDMGINDEAAARQALIVTGGDLQAALDLLFGSS